MGRFAAKRAQLEDLLFARIDELGIARSQVAILTESEIGFADPKAPLVAVFFGYKGVVDGAHQVLDRLLTASMTIIPCVDAIADIPPARHDATGKQAKEVVDQARIVAGKDAEMKERYGV